MCSLMTIRMHVSANHRIFFLMKEQEENYYFVHETYIMPLFFSVPFCLFSWQIILPIISNSDKIKM